MYIKLRFKVKCVTLIFFITELLKLVAQHTIYSLVEPSQSSICIPHKLESVLQIIEKWSLWKKAECGVVISTNSFNVESERVQTSTHRQPWQ